MTHVNSRLTVKNRDQLRNRTLGNRVWVTFTFCMLNVFESRVATLQTDVLRFTVIAENEGADDDAGGTEAAAAAAAGGGTGLAPPRGVANVTVRVLDVNDNPPVIVDPSPWSSRVANGSERRDLGVCAAARAGDRLLRVRAHDPDSGPNARLRYSLLDADDDDVTSPSSSSSSEYFSIDDADGWIVARRDLRHVEVGRTFAVQIVVTDLGRPPLSTNATLLLTISDADCAAASAAAGGDGGRATGSLRVAVVASAVLLPLLSALVVVLVLTRCRRRRGRHAEEKERGGGAGVVTERRWTEADGAAELTAKQKLNSAERTTSMPCYRHPADDAGFCSDSGGVGVGGGGSRSCFNIQHEFEVVWQASSACYLRQVCCHFTDGVSSVWASGLQESTQSVSGPEVVRSDQT